MLNHRQHPRSSPVADPSESPAGNPFILVGTIVAAKVTTIVVVLAISRSSGAGILVAATTWHWAIVLAALVAAPVAFAVRLRRVRARRAELLRGEWQVEPVELVASSATPPAVPGPPRHG